MIKGPLLGKLEKLAESSEVSFLSTVNSKGFPETRAMLNLRNGKMFPNLKGFFTDIAVAYFSSNTSSEKMKQIFSSRKASVYYTNAETFEGLLLIGSVEIIADKELKNDFWQDNWKMYYKGGIDDPDYALLKFKASSYKYYNGNFEVVSGEI